MTIKNPNPQKRPYTDAEIEFVEGCASADVFFLEWSKKFPDSPRPMNSIYSLWRNRSTYIKILQERRKAAEHTVTLHTKATTQKATGESTPDLETLAKQRLNVLNEQAALMREMNTTLNKMLVLFQKLDKQPENGRVQPVTPKPVGKETGLTGGNP